MVQGGQILVIKAPIWGGETAARLAGVVSGVLLAYLAEKGAGTRSLFLLDEAPRLSDRIDFASATALLRSSGVCVGLICQDVSQFGREELRDPILANCETILSLRNPGHETVRFLQKKLGSRRSTSVTRSRDPHSGRASISEAFADSAVLGEREISQVPWVEYPAIILCPRITTKPIVVDLGR
jgi:type IV secretory pathway TraG/TraD family ATPase VirD4